MLIVHNKTKNSILSKIYKTFNSLRKCNNSTILSHLRWFNNLHKKVTMRKEYNIMRKTFICPKEYKTKLKAIFKPDIPLAQH